MLFTYEDEGLLEEVSDYEREALERQALYYDAEWLEGAFSRVHFDRTLPQNASAYTLTDSDDPQRRRMITFGLRSYRDAGPSNKNFMRVFHHEMGHVIDGSHMESVRHVLHEPFTTAELRAASSLPRDLEGFAEIHARCLLTPSWVVQGNSWGSRWEGHLSAETVEKWLTHIWPLVGATEFPTHPEWQGGHTTMHLYHAPGFLTTLPDSMYEDDPRLPSAIPVGTAWEIVNTQGWEQMWLFQDGEWQGPLVREGHNFFDLGPQEELRRTLYVQEGDWIHGTRAWNPISLIGPPT